MANSPLIAQQFSGLKNAAAAFSADAQMKHGSWSMAVADENGKLLFKVNENTGLMPASTLKLLTSATALDVLGADYRYTTSIGYDGKIENGRLNGNLVVKPSGDPSLGSWRYQQANGDRFLENIASLLAKEGIHQINGGIAIDTSDWNQEMIPDGWIWQDLGNYYGAGAAKLNWHENQYDLFLRSPGHIGGKVEIIGTSPKLYGLQFKAELYAAAKGSGDNAYIYNQPADTNIMVRGTIPVNENKFSISGSYPQPAKQFKAALEAALQKKGIDIREHERIAYADAKPMEAIYEYHSPTLDSLVYWFLRRSINLYGEAFLRSLALKANGHAAADEGITMVQRYWDERGIDQEALSIVDGSGLSPLNRVTTLSLVKLLTYARGRNWYSSFYDGLPLYNGMKLKSGTIRGAKWQDTGFHARGTPRNEGINGEKSTPCIEKQVSITGYH